MDKLKKAELERRDELVKKFRDAETEIDDAYDKLNEAVEEFNGKLTAYNEIVSEAAGWRDDLVNEIDSYISDKSEKWQEGDKGQSVSSWKDDLEMLDFDDIEALEVPNKPTFDHAETLEGMPEEAT